jgi:hypothetical protein
MSGGSGGSVIGRGGDNGGGNPSTAAGHPGNDKPVGGAGEHPSGRPDQWGGGTQGRSDGDAGSKGNGRNHDNER